MTKPSNPRVSAARDETRARGETFYPGPSRVHLASFPPKERWDDWSELDSRAWPRRVEKRYMLVPTTCFNCESACGLLAYVDRETFQVRKLEGNPEHPGSRGRNCAKGPATHNQINDPHRILHPMKRVGARGSGQWRRVGWDEVLDDLAARIRKALEEKRHDEIMYHVGRPGEDGFTERILAAWGVDGYNSHTNICSSSARAGYQFWTGMDRPSPDYANAEVVLLVSSHLETGHYFNPHAQRIMEAKKNGARLVVFDTRLSNTATHADAWISPYPGSEPAIFLAVAHHLIRNGLYNRDFVRRWWNWREYLAAEHPGAEPTFESFERILEDLYADYTFDFAAKESGVDAAEIERVAEIVATAGTRLASHNWRSAGSGNEGGWQVARTLFLLNALLGAVATEGGTSLNAWNKFVPKPIHPPPPPDRWNELQWPREYPLTHYEMSILLPHFLRAGRGKLDVYFTRVYNPIWTNPDGFSWLEALADEDLVGLHVALTPTWNETAYFADYVLPMGHASERHDLHSYETHDGQWIGFRQPVLRAARQRLGEDVTDTREVNPGEVWEENEFWMELTWRIDRDGRLGIRRYVESEKNPGERLGTDEYYAYVFESSVPGLPEAAAAEGLSPLGYMRRYGVFEVAKKVGAVYEQEAPDEEAGVEVDDTRRRGFRTPSRLLEFYSPTLAAWGWAEAAIPTYLESHVHPDRLEEGQVPLISTFRLPVQIHTRSANAKWLDEIAHTNPLWLHPRDAGRFGVDTGDLVRVETEIGHFVVKAWVSEGIRPGVVACSHHMGRWRLADHPADNAQRQLTSTVRLEREATRWHLKRQTGAGPYASQDPDTRRIWWTDVGVHQNLTFPVHPDPLSGMHCWHQAVRVAKAGPDDRYGDVVVDTARSRAVYEKWLARARPADLHSPDGTRRPYWMSRPLKPTRDAYRLPDES